MNTLQYNDTIGLLEPISQVTESTNLLGARCINRIHDNNTTYLVLSPTDEDIHIQPKQQVAPMTSIQSDNVVSINVDGDDITDINTTVHTTETDEDYIDNYMAFGRDVSQMDLSEEEKHHLFCIGKNRSVFTKDLAEVGTSNLHHHIIETGDAIPVRQRPYRTNPQMKDEVRRQVADMEQHHIHVHVAITSCHGEEERWFI